jgi:hypothetical protein
VLLLASVVAVAAVYLALRGPADGPNGAVRNDGDHAGADTHTPESAVQLTDSGSIPGTGVESWRAVDNPAADGWDTEAFNAQAGEQLKSLAKLIEKPAKLTAPALDDLVSRDFASGPLVPSKLAVVYDEGPISVERPESPLTADPAAASEEIRGRANLADAFKQLAAPYAEGEDVRAKFKLFRIEADERFVTTRQYFSLSARTSDGMLEQNATWLMRWQRGVDDSLPKIVWIGVEQFEQVRLRSTGRPLFADYTASVLGDSDCYREQLLLGTNHWMRRIPGPFSAGLNGIAVGDVNGDGLEDIYVCQMGGLPNRLLVQQPDGTLLDVSRQWGVDWLADSRGALLVDLDNDGDQDLALAVKGGLLLAANRGDRFEVRSVLDTGDDTMSLASADYDGDGRLDLFVCVYHATMYDAEMRSDAPVISGLAAANFAIVYHDAKTGGRNRLFRNVSTSPDQWSFTDVSESIGLDTNNRRYSYAAVWEDYDNDGDQDLYIGNDFGQNNLFRNDVDSNGQRRLTDVSARAAATDRAFGMGVTWSDYNRDGRMDVYVSNMFSAAGNRIAFQQRFRAGGDPRLRRDYQYLARGNTLLQNIGDGEFRDTSEAAGVTMGRWAWGCNFADVNNDGWDDLLVANGYVTGEGTGDL